MNNATNLPAIEAIVIGASAGGVEALLNILARCAKASAVCLSSWNEPHAK